MLPGPRPLASARQDWRFMRVHLLGGGYQDAPGSCGFS